MRTRGVALRTLASLAALALAAAIGCSRNDDAAPTGHIVIFGAPEVLLVPAAGGEPERLEIDDEEFWDVAFSDDGQWVAFNPSPFVDEGGFRIRNLEDGETSVIAGQPPEDRFESYDLAWAPDGRSLAFVNGAGVYVIRIDGTGLRRLGNGSSPTWTPDSEHIVFASGDNRRNVLEIAVIGVDGAGLRTLGHGNYPDVSPSGDEVAYSTPTGVFVQPFAGGGPRLVVPNAFGPVWSPDGAFLAFTRYTSCPTEGHGVCSGRVFVVPVDGREPRAVGPDDRRPRSAWTMASLSSISASFRNAGADDGLHL